MEGKIQILAEAVANKIAAGEVVERPAAVVKELLENAIDAGADQIVVEITESGAKRIKITDNGCGMTKADALLSLERHATSKIRAAEDLFQIHSLGFRGEALPSIAAVSHFVLQTRTENDLVGTAIKASGGEITKVAEIGCPTGTMIAIEDLFFNTPARLKYLKTPSTEMGHIIDIVNHLSLAYPAISFRLQHNDRPVLFSTGNNNLPEIIFNIFGKQIAKEMIPVNTAGDSLTITGYVGKPSAVKNNRQAMLFFVNGRYIKSRIIGRAVEEAYKEWLPIRKYPVVVLNFLIEPDKIDVNVHPTKTEIRFSEERELYLLTYQTVSQALKSLAIIPEINSPEQVAETPATYAPLDLPWTAPAPKHSQPAMQSLPIVCTTEAKNDFPRLSVVGQILKTYIVLQNANGMYLLDQHAAHERILYEKFKKSRAQERVTQNLLIPINLEVTVKEKTTWEQIEEKVQELGFHIEKFGGQSYLIRGIPLHLEEKNVLPVIREIIEQAAEKTVQQNLWERSLIIMACRTAIKAGDHLEIPEMSDLVEQLAQTERPYTCPHGRPTIIDFSRKQIEEYFKRR